MALRSVHCERLARAGIGRRRKVGGRSGVDAVRAALVVALVVGSVLAVGALLAPPAKAASVITTVTINGGSNPYRGLYDPANGSILVTNSGSNKISPIWSTTHTSGTYRTQANCGTGCSASNGSYDPSSGYAYFATTSNGFLTLDPGLSSGWVSTTGSSPMASAYFPPLSWTIGIGQSAAKLTAMQMTTIQSSFALGKAPWTLAYAASNYTMWVAEGAYGSLGQLEVFNKTNISNTLYQKPLAIIGDGKAPGYATFDPADGYVYVANQLSDNVTIINAKTYANVANVGLGTGTAPVAIAYDPGNHDVYVANSGSTNVSVLSGSSLIASVPVGTTPDSLTYEPLNETMIVTNSGSDNVSVISRTNLIASTVSLASGAGPDAGVFDPADSYVYIADHGTSASVSVLTDDQTITGISGPRAIAVDGSGAYTAIANFAASTVSVVPTGFTGSPASTTVAVGTHPIAIVFSQSTGHFYVANNGSDNVSVIGLSAGSWKVVATVALTGGSSPSNLIYDSHAPNDVFVADWGTAGVSVITTTNTVSGVAVGANPIGLAVDPNSGDVYVTDYGAGAVDVLGPTGLSLGSVAVGTAPVAAAWNPASGNCYVANYGSGTYSVVRGTTLLGTRTAGTHPGALAFDYGDNDIYLADNGSANVKVIDTSTNLVVATLAVGTNPAAIVYDNATNLVFVANYGSGNVSSIADPGLTSVLPLVVGTISVGTHPIALVSTAAAGSAWHVVYVADYASSDVRGL